MEQKPRSRSLGGFEEDGSPLEFPAVDTTIPFPRGHASDDISRRDASDIQGTPEEQRSRSRTWALDRDGHISTLFGPVQSMWGVLLQRSVQVGILAHSLFAAVTENRYDRPQYLGRDGLPFKTSGLF